MQNLSSTRELVDEYVENVTELGITVSRTFLYNVYDTNHSANVPDIGDPMDNIIEGIPNRPINVICRTKTKVYVDNHYGTYKLICEYSNEPTNLSQYGGNGSTYDMLPLSLEYNGDFQTINPYNSGYISDSFGGNISPWYFMSDNAQCTESLPFRVVGATAKFQIVMTDEIYKNFINISTSKIGTVNCANPVSLGASGGSDGSDSSLFESYPGCWLFIGYSAEMIENYISKPAWKVELNFAFRNPYSGNTVHQVNNNGWCKLLKEFGEWDIPIYLSSTGPSTIYHGEGSSNFASIFSLNF